MGIVKKINITNQSGTNTFYVADAYLESGMGIVGDRYYNNFKHPREQVTLIEEEIIQNFEKKIDKKIDSKDFRRNIITEGIELTKFINKKIKMDKLKFIKSETDDNIINIVYRGKVYGQWDEDANIRYPEDLTLDEDLSILIKIGIEIGKQMNSDDEDYFE